LDGLRIEQFVCLPLFQVASYSKRVVDGKKFPAVKENGTAEGHGAKLNGAVANGTPKETRSTAETRVPLSRNARTGEDRQEAQLPIDKTPWSCVWDLL
jgi:hypothetical protein